MTCTHGVPITWTPRECRQCEVEMTDYEVIDAMQTYGGSFVQAYARAWQAADIINQIRLREAFLELWREYETIALAAKDRPRVL